MSVGRVPTGARTAVASGASGFQTNVGGEAEGLATDADDIC
jgi:hypothetical protein